MALKPWKRWEKLSDENLSSLVVNSRNISWALIKVKICIETLSCMLEHHIPYDKTIWYIEINCFRFAATDFVGVMEQNTESQLECFCPYRFLAVCSHGFTAQWGTLTLGYCGPGWQCSCFLLSLVWRSGTSQVCGSPLSLNDKCYL